MSTTGVIEWGLLTWFLAAVITGPIVGMLLHEISRDLPPAPERPVVAEHRNVEALQ